MVRNEKFDLAILLALSIGLSIYLFIQTHVLSLDGAFQYIPIAKDLASGFYEKALAHNQQPLYSFLIAVVSGWIPDFEQAGKLVSSFFGVLVVFPVYFLGKRIFDEKIAFLSSFFLIIHPYVRRYSGDVLKESTYLFFLATALWLAWKAIQEERKILFFFIPLLSVLTYLVRPDGLEILLIVFFYVLFIKKFSIPGRKRVVLLLLVISSCLLLVPYLVYLRDIRGEWVLGKAKSVMEMLGLGMQESPVPYTERILYSMKRLNTEIVAIFHPVYLGLLAVGFFNRLFTRFKKGDGFLLAFFVLHYSVLFLLVLNTTVWGADKTIQADYLSRRHVLPLLLFSAYWIGDGFSILFNWIHGRVGNRILTNRLEPRKKSAILFMTLLILFTTVVLFKTLKLQRYDRLPEKWAGIWVKSQPGESKFLFTSLPRIVYYSEVPSEYIHFEKEKMDKAKASMASQETVYLALREEETTLFPDVAEFVEREFHEVKRFGGKGMETIVIYKKKSNY